LKARKLTAAQEAAKQERRARFQSFVKTVADMGANERDALAAKMIGAVSVEGRPYSPRNAAILALQCPSATILGGFRQWLAAGRCVRKGEHGHMLWVPTSKKQEAAQDGTEAGGSTYFIIGTVFDISQTTVLDQEAPVAVEQETEQLQAA
jgi:hypothetical protein